jgi:EAL domain-containing protein (putative c-di-GMP-specific phosphodiesterase class I)
MYAAKAQGKGTVAVYRPEMLDAARERLDLREDLRHAADRGELRVVYQPLVELDGRRVVGVEALLRWQHPVQGEIGPARFIPLAEETGMIVPIGDWVLRRALADLATWPDHLYVSVNVAARQLSVPGFAGDVADALAEAGIEPARVWLEVTESALADDLEDVRRTLDALRGLGVRVAVDDFGTGYSSLSRLRGLAIDAVKVDRSFVADVLDRGQGAALVRSIVELGRSLDLEVVAEGIENPDQERFLREAHCRLGQGFLFARPLPAGAVAVLVAPQAGGASDRRAGLRSA